MKSKKILLVNCFLFLFSILFYAQIDYVELVIPDELKNNPQAVEYLKNDVKQLNKMFYAIDDLATDFEELGEIISKIDINDASEIEQHRVEVEGKLIDLGSSFFSVNMRLMWYIGKDLLADKESMPTVFQKLDSGEKIAFRKSMKHIHLKKQLLEQRAEAFAKRLEALSFD